MTERQAQLRESQAQQRMSRVQAMLGQSTLYRELSPQDQAALHQPDSAIVALPKLLATTLCSAVERRLRTSLGREFQQHTAELNRVRGHVDVLRTARKQLLTRARVACRFETLTTDTALNRAVRTALRLLQEHCSGRTGLLCRKFATAMERSGVQGPCPTAAELREIALRQARLKSPDAIKDAAMLEAARLTHALAPVLGQRFTKHTRSTQENSHAPACA